ncbi:cupredoxin domain-containing protein [Candidatus Woesearchaeota archaeon]|nr:cupredoxin domain-containing protein [Candidatus Woesearchaeota archaeon]
MNGNLIVKIIAGILLIGLLSTVILAQTGVFDKQYQQQNNAIGSNQLPQQIQGGGSCSAGGGGCGCGGGASVAVPDQAIDTTNAVAAVENSGVQEIAVSFQNNGYYPSIIKLKKDVPVKMTFDLNTVQGCMRAVQIKGLGVGKYLKEGDNVVTFTPQKTGTFAMTCSMGMGKATIIIEA